MNKFYKRLLLVSNIFFFILISNSALSKQFAYVANNMGVPSASVSVYEIGTRFKPYKGNRTNNLVALGYKPVLIRSDPDNGNVFIVEQPEYSTQQNIFIYGKNFATDGIASFIEGVSILDGEVQDILFYNEHTYIVATNNVYLYSHNQLLPVLNRVMGTIKSAVFIKNSIGFDSLFTIQYFPNKTEGFVQYNMYSDHEFLYDNQLWPGISSDNYLVSQIIVDRPISRFMFWAYGEPGVLGVEPTFYFFGNPKNNLLHIASDNKSEFYTDGVGVNISPTKSAFYFISDNTLGTKSAINGYILKVNKDMRGDVSEKKILTENFASSIQGIVMDEDQEYLYIIVSGENKIYQYLINHEDGSLTKTGIANTGYLPVSVAVSPHFFY